MLREQYEYYKANLDILLSKYADRFVVIKNCEVIADYDSFDKAYQDMSEKEGVGTFIIHRCVKEEDEPVFSYSGNVSFGEVQRV